MVFPRIPETQNGCCTSPAAAVLALLHAAFGVLPPFSSRCTLHLASRRRELVVAACTSLSPAVSAPLHAAWGFSPPGSCWCSLQERFRRRFRTAARCTGVSSAVSGALQQPFWERLIKSRLTPLFLPGDDVRCAKRCFFEAQTAWGGLRDRRLTRRQRAAGSAIIVWHDLSRRRAARRS